MSWMQRLHETYKQAQKLMDLPNDQQIMPVGHTRQNAHIHVVINAKGEFRRASVLKKTQIILPVTEISESRTSGEAPHPLSDKIQYVAKDFLDYGGKKSFFPAYVKQLTNWCQSEAAHPKAQAILAYVEQGRLIANLVAEKILFIDECGQLLSHWRDVDQSAPDIFSVLPKNKGEIEVGSALVAWSVESPGDPTNETWHDQRLQQSWLDYLATQEKTMGLCCVIGEEQNIARLHPGKIRHSGDKAKLISSNDNVGFTFRGRFVEDSQVATISAEASQKSHAALAWLIRRQGHRQGEQCIVVWALSGKKVVQPLTDAFDVLLASDSDEDDLSIQLPMEDSSSNTPDLSRNFLGYEAAVAFKRKLQGYRAELSHHDQLSILSLDSATPGRMAITYYQEILPDPYYDAIEAWQTDFAWYQRHNFELPSEGGKKPKKTTLYPILAPSPYAIAQAAYGKTLSDALKKQVNTRLLPCIVEGTCKPFPLDLLRSCIINACNRMGFEAWEWERNLGVTCALYKGYHARCIKITDKRKFDVALDENNHSRDYLYGRLLAVAEHLESLALSIANEKRATTAERYFQRFAERPFSTWRNIEMALRPYIERLRNIRSAFLHLRQHELDQITSSFNHHEFMDDNKLTGEFLLGYHSQKMHYSITKSDNKNDTKGADELEIHAPQEHTTEAHDTTSGASEFSETEANKD